jgi:hypothetical protein
VVEVIGTEVRVRVHWEDCGGSKSYVMDVPSWDSFIKSMADQVVNGGMINVKDPAGAYAYPARNLLKIEEVR